MKIEAILHIFVAFIGVAASTRHYCYSGSNLYQSGTEDCTAKNPGYNGTWYCTKIEVCEPYISKSRICIITRGCATAEECTDSSSGIYSGAALEVNGVYPAGMTIKPSCCAAQDFPSDDTIAIEYNNICNGATHSQNFGYVILISLISASVWMLL